MANSTKNKKDKNNLILLGIVGIIGIVAIVTVLFLSRGESRDLSGEAYSYPSWINKQSIRDVYTTTTTIARKDCRSARADLDRAKEEVTYKMNQFFEVYGKTKDMSDPAVKAAYDDYIKAIGYQNTAETSLKNCCASDSMGYGCY